MNFKTHTEMFGGTEINDIEWQTALARGKDNAYSLSIKYELSLIECNLRTFAYISQNR